MLENYLTELIKLVHNIKLKLTVCLFTLFDILGPYNHTKKEVTQPVFFICISRVANNIIYYDFMYLTDG